MKRIIGPDPIYGSELVQKLINVVMWRGKKSTARRIVYGAIENIARKTQGNREKALELFSKACERIVPIVEVRPRRVGGSVYQIPVEVTLTRGRALALRWIIAAAAARSDKTMADRLAYELLDAYDGKGGASKKKVDMHKMAESNKAFSHYAW